MPRELSFLEAHYIRWRLSPDDLAKSPTAKTLYQIQNDLGDETMNKLEAAWQEYLKENPDGR